MPKNKGLGGKNYKKGPNKSVIEHRDLHTKEDGQEYAQVKKMLGNGRLECFCFDGVTRMAHIPGRMSKKIWIAIDDIVLVGLRDYQDSKCDVMIRYTADEVRILKSSKEIPDTVKVVENVEGLGLGLGLGLTGDIEDEGGFVFDDI